ncbi:MAG: hypothetical protein K0S04_869 [Herbinix sp.]|jgi:hypothetical protein|nr:hypothetical protein [Herbinix sp.]
MSLSISVANGSKIVDITKLVPTITWSGEYQSCARTLEFGIVSSSTDKNVPAVPCELGSIVTFKQDNRTLFVGYIFERQMDTGNSIINIICYDRGIYLKRNEGTYECPGMTPETIVKEICTNFGISMGSVAATGVKITRNFIGVSLYKIIQTAYTLAAEVTGKNYMIRFAGADLTVIEKALDDKTIIIEGGSNLMSASISESISNMINQVTIYNSNDKLIGTQRDTEAIKLYGLMQSYMSQADGEDVTNKAKMLISENGISQKISVNNLGNLANITGGTVVVREPYTGKYGLFYIDADVHTWKSGQYYNKLTLNFKNIMDEQEAGALPNKDGSKTKG